MPAPTIDRAHYEALRDSMSVEHFRMLGAIFAADLTRLLTALGLAGARPDRIQLASIAHEMIGAAGNMGAVALADTARELEECAATAPPATLATIAASLWALAAAAQSELDRLATKDLCAPCQRS